MPVSHLWRNVLVPGGMRKTGVWTAARQMTPGCPLPSASGPVILYHIKYDMENDMVSVLNTDTNIH